MKIIDTIRDAIGMRTTTDEAQGETSNKAILDATTKGVDFDAVGQVIIGDNGSTSLSTADADKNWAHIAVAKIADVVAGTRWALYKMDKDGNREEVVVDVVSDILDKPNEVMTWRQFVYRLVGQRHFTGISPVYTYTNGSKVELEVLDSTRLTVKFDAFGRRPVGYKYIWPKSGQVQTMGVHEVKRFIKPDFFKSNGTSGVSERILDWLKVENNNIKLQQDMAEFRSFVGGTLETNVTDEDTLKRWRDVLRKRTEKKGSDLVLPKGIKYNRNTLSLKDMEMSTNDKENGAKILKAFGVPKELLGDVDTSGRANVDGAYYGFVKYTIDPILQELREFFNTQVFANLLDDDIYIDYDNIVPEDKEFALNEHKTSLAGNGWRTVNEVRAELGLDPVEGGDELRAPAGNNNISTTPAKSVRQKAIPDFMRVKMLKAKKREQAKKSVVDDATKDVNWDKIELGLIEYNRKGFEVRTIARAQKLQENLMAIASKQEESVLKRLKKIAGKKSAGIELSDAEVDAITTLEVKDDAEQFYIESKDILTAIAVDEGANAVGMVANPAGNYNAEAKTLVKELKRVLSIRAISANKTTQRDLAKEIKAGIKAGDSLAGLTKRVEGVFGTIEKYRAKTIAHDVAFTSANSAMRSAYEQVGVHELKWFTSQGSNVCDFCKEMHGKTISVQENFFNKGDVFEVEAEGKDGKKTKKTMEIDFDDVANPPIHTRCNCYILPE